MPPPTSYNAGAKGVSFFTPQHIASPGTPLNPNADNIPTLFKPLQIRGATLRNRIIVAPMCQYSTADSGPAIGALTPYHVTTLGHYALKGAGVVFIEATGVQPNGRISPNCPGIWADEASETGAAQMAGVRAVAEMVKSQGALCAIQLAHAGRKSSCVAPFVASRLGRRSARATEEVGGWPEDVVGPSGGPDFVWDGRAVDDPKGGYWPPRELTEKEIQQMVRDWASAAERSVKAGVDIVELHAAHGYCLHQFLSPISNRRTDRYGGSFEGRTRLLIEIIQAIRAVIPASMPLFLRVSATEWMDETDVGKRYGSWDLESTSRLAKIVADLGVDLLDVSSGGNHPDQRINMFDSKDYQIKMAQKLRSDLRAVGKQMLVGAVGLITEAEQARDIVQGVQREANLTQEAEAARKMTDASAGDPMADVVLVARQFMREPEWVLRVAWKLGLDVAWPSQFDRVRFPKI